jgi:hypothetical protein
MIIDDHHRGAHEPMVAHAEEGRTVASHTSRRPDFEATPDVPAPRAGESAFVGRLGR